MIATRDSYYAAMADKRERDPISEDHGRATVPNGRGFGLWQRMHPGQSLLWVDDVDGRPVWITRTQAELIGLLQTFSDGTAVRMRTLAETLGVAPSTVSRGMVKLASFGLVTYSTSRGRHGATIIYRMVGEQFGDVRRRLREAAKARVRQWSKTAADRVSRLISNVASCTTWREIEEHGLSHYYLVSMVATLERPWTAEEIAETLGEG
jgi:predicted transcriptional regulator